MSQDKGSPAYALVKVLNVILDQPDDIAARNLNGLFTKAEIEEVLMRGKVRKKILKMVKADGQLSMQAVSKQCGCSVDLVSRVWRAIRDDYPPEPAGGDLCIAIPKEGRARRLVEDVLLKSGFRMDEKAKSIVDIKNGLSPIAFNIMRGREIPAYMKAGAFQAAFLGNDKITEVQAEARLNGNDPVELGVIQEFFLNSFRMCMAVPKLDEGVRDRRKLTFLNGKTIATSYPSTLKEFLAARNITAREIRYLSGGVEESCRVLGMDAIMDIVETGRSLERNGLVTLGKPLYQGNMSFIELKDSARPDALNLFAERLRGNMGALKAA